MLVITNTCLGARICEAKGIKFNNPFMWNRIDLPDFLELMNEYSEIDFKKFSTTLEDRFDRKSVKCVIDNKITIHFTHWVWDYTRHLWKHKWDLYDRDIIHYAINKYKDRIDRMLQLKDQKPLYIFSFQQYKSKEDYSEMLRTLNEQDRDDLIVLAHNSHFEQLSQTKTRIIFMDDNQLEIQGHLDGQIIMDVIKKHTGIIL